MQDFEFEIDGDSEDHQYALDLIKNLIEVAQKDGLTPEILMEVAMFYSVGFNLTNGDRDIVRELLTKALEQLGVEGEIADRANILH
ncbi:hypothetical protein OBB00_07890 [Gammaproteobacteria bacterium]|nr:hypothetical protein [Gammaproteobacteria bacterium]